MSENSPVIELEYGEGQVCRCRVLDVFGFDGKEYVLLVDLETSATVIMRLIERGDQAIFQAIENDEEFERVTEYVKALVTDMFGGGE